MARNLVSCNRFYRILPTIPIFYVRFDIFYLPRAVLMKSGTFFILNDIIINEIILQLNNIRILLKFSGTQDKICGGARVVLEWCFICHFYFFIFLT